MRAAEYSGVLTPRVSLLMRKAFVRVVGDEIPPEQRLWVEVVLDAMKCACNRDTARKAELFFESGADFETVCGLAGVDADFARDLFKNGVKASARGIQHGHR